jgi:DNA-binding XRE family transcriptional regulator
VAKKLNVSVETIRSWEKALKTEERSASWKAARVAGRYKEDIAKLDLPYNLESFGSVSILELADYFLKTKDIYSLDQIRERLLELQRSEDPEAASA